MASDKDKPTSLQSPDEYAPKSTMKPQGKSMFDAKPRRQTPQEFQQKVQTQQETLTGYNRRAADLFVQFQRALADKTLPQNRNIFNHESEKEMLQNMLQLATEINNDGEEQEGMGSLTWIILLFKTALAQRDRMNEMEYALVSLQKKMEGPALTDYINKEISAAIDKKKGSE